MKQEDKEILIKDLCARLPYGVKIRIYIKNADFKVTKYDTDKLCLGNLAYILSICESPWREVKPYLFPLSSMTEEQKKEFLDVAGYEIREEDCGRHTETYYYDMVGHEQNFYPNSDAIDWLDKNHFDYRGLIPMGLAEDATDKNIY